MAPGQLAAPRVVFRNIAYTAIFRARTTRPHNSKINQFLMIFGLGEVVPNFGGHKGAPKLREIWPTRPYFVKLKLWIHYV